MRTACLDDKPRPMKTHSCQAKHCEFCPGWFREDITRTQPSSGLCCCDCHEEEDKARTARIAATN